MSDYQGRTYYLQGSSYTVEKTIAEGKVYLKTKYFHFVTFYGRKLLMKNFSKFVTIEHFSY